MNPNREWTPILNADDQQIGWNTGKEEIKFSSHHVFLMNEGMMAIALHAKARQGLQPRQVHQSKGRKKGKVAPKQRGAS